MRRVLYASLTLILLGFVAQLQFVTPSLALRHFPRPEGYVNDFADMISPAVERRLERRLEDFERRTTHEVAVATVDDLQGTTVEDFAVRLFEDWKIGKADADNGVLILIARSERRLRIEVGYGLEPVLTDAEAHGIVVRDLEPAFKKSDFDGGVERAVDSVVAGLSGEELPEIDPEADRGEGRGGISLLVAGFWVITIGSWLTAILARSTSWWAGGVIGGIAGLISIAFIGLVAGGIAAVLLAVLGSFLDFSVSRNFRLRKAQKRKPSWWAGGWWGPGTSRSGFRSSGGFGGFGGGSSGGGGASGGW